MITLDEVAGDGCCATGPSPPPSVTRPVTALGEAAGFIRARSEAIAEARGECVPVPVVRAEGEHRRLTGGLGVRSLAASSIRRPSADAGAATSSRELRPRSDRPNQAVRAASLPWAGVPGGAAPGDAGRRSMDVRDMRMPGAARGVRAPRATGDVRQVRKPEREPAWWRTGWCRPAGWLSGIRGVPDACRHGPSRTLWKPQDWAWAMVTAIMPWGRRYPGRTPGGWGR